MAEQSGSPAFKPPVNTVTDDSPMIIRVPMDRVDWGFRKSQYPDQRQDTPLSHIPNGK